MAAVEDPSTFMIDETYEFSAPRFYDFIDGETEEDMRRAELWFETALGCAPSPSMPRIKAGRSVQLDTLCGFGEAEYSLKDSTSSETTSVDGTVGKPQVTEKDETKLEIIAVDNTNGKPQSPQKDETRTLEIRKEQASNEVTEKAPVIEKQTSEAKEVANNEAILSIKKETKKQQTAKKIATIVRNPSALKSQHRPPLSQSRTNQAASVKRDTTAKSAAAALNFTLENQAIKRQKLEGGKSRQILNLKTETLPHKSKLGTSSFFPSTSKSSKEDRKVYVRETAAPFVSMAEMMNRFHSSTREMSLPGARSSCNNDSAPSITQTKPKLTLTRPKGPDFETSQRVRPVRIKSSAEIEEEMMAKIPKFKARPVNKKILEAPSLAAPQRSTPSLPEFHEFHLKTMERANQNAETSSIVSTESAPQIQQWKPHLTAPKSPALQTTLRARPPKIKSSEELEKEELEKAPKFKARPLNKKIFESKGELGLYCNPKRQVTIPQEFHFAVDERIPPPAAAAVFDLFDKLSISSDSHCGKQIPRNTARPLNKKIFESKGELGLYCNPKRQVTIPQEFHFAVDERIPPPAAAAVFDLFDKLSISSDSHCGKQIPRNTAPNPFHLRTEERGAEKEKKFVLEVVQKQIEEEKARVPKATPYPYTTDYPVIPPKPEPKHCTKPEPFQLESVARHVEEMQREMEERQRKEKEEAEMRKFKAQPVLKEDPIPVPEKVRKPLTEVQGFNLHVVHRAVDRSEFDKKIKEKEMMYKRYRDEAESAKMMEEEKALKRLRRTLVPHARPVPNFNNPFLPQKSGKDITKPKPPKLLVDKRKERRKFVGAVEAATSVASQMR